MRNFHNRFSGKTRVGRHLIYGLIDPRSQTLMYIGKTHKRREVRLKEHLESSNTENRFVSSWIYQLRETDDIPSIFVLERVPSSSNWREAEQRQIGFWKTLDKSYLPLIYPPMTMKSSPTLINGVELLNMTKGG